jgi:hypothetical protein
MCTIIFGTVVEMKQMSAKERLKRKKYIGVWSWESEMMAKMMSRLPNVMTRYMERSNSKRMGCSLGSSESSMRWNSETLVRFCAFVLLGHLLKIDF